MLLVAALPNPAQAAPPAALTPSAIAGWGWNVMDLEAMRAWYIDKLGLRQVGTYARGGKVVEYILGYGEGSDASVIVALLAAPQRQPGPSVAGRLILRAPDAKALAAHLAGQGVPVREVLPGIAYFITDPEGNPVELYTPPAK